MEFSFIEEEVFDFDLPLSPDEQERPDDEQDEDEIFFGPVGHIERCVASNAEAKSVKDLEHLGEDKPMSPLNAEQIVEIFKEATSVAVMFKSTSTADELPTDISSSDIPELIKDARKKELSKISADGKENDLSITNDYVTVGDNYNVQCPLQVNKSEAQPEQIKEGENYVVRRRTLKERNRLNDMPQEKSSTGLVKAKSSLLKPGKSALKRPNVVSKRNVSPLKINSLLIYGVTGSPKKDNTPLKSSSSSRADRSFSSTRSSSASDTSFTEDSKTSKLPMASRSGLKPPSFTAGRRRRTSSNSSTSSTSSTPAFNPNETFIISKAQAPAKEPIATKKTSLQMRQIPANKASLTNIGKSLAKPTFAKPSEPSKISNKMQPMKALPRVAAIGSNRSASDSGARSPSRAPATRRTASAGTTPGQGSRNANTPRKNGNIQRRSTTGVSSASAAPSRTPIRTRDTQNPGARGAANSPNPSTPRAGRRSGVGVPGSAGVRRQPDKRRESGVVETAQGGSIKKRGAPSMQGPSTPTNKDDAVEKLNKRKSMSASCNKRRSLLPTANLSQTKTQTRSRLNKSLTSASLSPAKIQFSPYKPRALLASDSSCGSNEDPVPLELSLTFTIEPEEEISEEQPLETTKSPQSPHNIQSETEVQNKDADDVTSAEPLMVTHELISGVSEPCVHASPLLKNVPEDDSKDPFSPGLLSPDLPQEGCLNPVVLQMDTADLIDLSHETPKRAKETDLIDLSAASPANIQEAKLVDI